MSRIQALFQNKKEKILSVYFTAGYPQLNDTTGLLNSLQESGVDMIELGMPYSDPIADGPVIQKSSAGALLNGMTIAKLFDQLKSFRKDINIPVILMGYLNPVLQFGFEKFCKQAAGLGIDGLIIPDLPPYEYESEYRSIVEKNKLDFIFLVTPETSADRILMLDKLSNGFLYAVSSSSTTGTGKDPENMETYLKRLEGLKLKNPVLVGFGIGDKTAFERACRHARGAVVGTAYIKALMGTEKPDAATRRFVSSFLG